MTSDLQERGVSGAWWRKPEAGGDVPARILGSIQAGNAFTVVTGTAGVASDLVLATVDRLHAAHIETTTIEAPLPSLATLTRAISTALSVVVDVERPLVVIVRGADALEPDAMLRLPALAGLRRSGSQVLCFLLIGRPSIWNGLGSIGLAALEQDEVAHIRVAAPAMFAERDEEPADVPGFREGPQPVIRVRPDDPDEDAATPFAIAADTRRRRPRLRLLAIGGGVVGLALAVMVWASLRDRPTSLPPARTPPPVVASLRPLPDLSPIATTPPTGPMPPALALPDEPTPAATPAPLPAPASPVAATPQPAAPFVAAPPAAPILPAVPPPPAPSPPAPQASSAPPATPTARVGTPPPAAPAAVTTTPPQPTASLEAVRPAPPMPQRLALPDAGALHVILRYGQASEASRLRAMQMADLLRNAGAAVDGPSAIASGPAHTTIGYFFNADRAAADRLAHRLPAHFIHVRTPVDPAAGTMMRPGELIITVGPDDPAAHPRPDPGSPD
ncbi:hypothetical protein [Lichenicoccus roseus]|uniref:Uncharacterized protein n=1 Tax=Lichenicoccus roseus TaxID=2683649 RepID=A0A5R9JBS0_9PROT|nr:hypothetical protein [Lichenicoccus roseus]TLU74193.1 hypothetical protein FE263_03005 [Lichenicoccus roseus]